MDKETREVEELLASIKDITDSKIDAYIEQPSDMTYDALYNHIDSLDDIDKTIRDFEALLDK